MHAAYIHRMTIALYSSKEKNGSAKFTGVSSIRFSRDRSLRLHLATCKGKQNTEMRVVNSRVA